MSKVTYKHYFKEDAKFPYDPKLFNPIKNYPGMVKPIGGFWACRDEEWNDWCNGESFCTNTHCMTFNISDNARVLEIHSARDLEPLPKQNFPYILSWDVLDFEALKKQYDAIEVFMFGDQDIAEGFDDTLYNRLYGWDVPSILIMNPDIIEVIDQQ